MTKPPRSTWRKRNDKTRIHRQQEEKIQFARADEFGKLRAIDEEKRLEDLLDEMARADQHHHLPFGPRADVVRVQIQDADETELQPEPKDFDENPEEKVAFETHLAGDGIFPQRDINAEIAAQESCGAGAAFAGLGSEEFMR